MFVVTGITGKVGGHVAHTLLAAQQSVRAVMRNPDKAAAWQQSGCEIAIADINDSAALSKAFMDAEGVFILVPPNFDPSPGFSEAKKIAASLRSALEAAAPERVVYLSTVGAQATQENLLTQHSIIEQALSNLPIPITFLRPAWFMENSAWDVAPAREGVIPSFLQPLDRKVPMVATADIGRVAAELVQNKKWSGQCVLQLEGPEHISPNDIAATFSKILQHPVRVEAIPHAAWEARMKSQGIKNPLPYIQMLDGFNEGWIAFENDKTTLKGKIGLETVLEALS
jgi:NAD(P)H dehydrogenase (quinone)